MKGTEDQSIYGGGAVVANVPLFVAAAHELKSPLALVRQLSFALDSDQLTPAELKKIARQITLVSERALRLTTDLTRTSRLEDGLFMLEPVNPLSLCEEVVAELQPLYRAKGRRLVVARRTRSLLAIANKDLLRRILLNFADNALHYSDSNSEVRITARICEGGAKIRLGVRDYGPAVPAGVWKKLESSLGVAAQPLHSRPDSSGLGIYITSQFAEAMQACVGATRHRDGATFYVDLMASRQLRLL